MPTDAELMRQFVFDQSQTAFAELVQRHVQLVYATALRLLAGNSGVAQDVTQTVFIDLARKAPRLVNREVIVSWLYSSTRYAASTARRTLGRRKKYEMEAAVMNMLTYTDDSDSRHILPFVEELVDSLNERDRALVVLRYFEGRSFAEVGKECGISEDAARVRTARLLEKLRASLERRGLTSTTAVVAAALGAPSVIAAPTMLAKSAINAAMAAGCLEAGGLGTTIFAIMNTAKVTAIAGSVAVLMTATAVLQSSRAGRHAAALTAAQQSLVDVTRNNADLSARIAHLERRSEVPQTSIPSQNANAPSAAEPTQLPSQRDLVLAHPELRSTFLKREALLIGTRYRPFLDAAGLTPEQRTEFVNAMVAEIDARWDFVEKWRAAEAEAKSPADVDTVLVAQREAAAKLAADTKIRLQAALGDKLRELSKYSAPERAIVEQVAAQLFDSEAPLSPEQARALQSILAETKPRGMSVSFVAGGATIDRAIHRMVGNQVNAQYSDGLDWFRPVTDAAMERARGVLTPRQVQALINVQAGQLIEYEIARARLNRRG